MNIGSFIPNASATGVLQSCKISDNANVRITTSNLTVAIGAFSVGTFAFAGGSITVPANGNWYIGIEFYSNALRVLPRLGHRGWVPVAYVTATTVITGYKAIVPALPTCRIPRTMSKIAASTPINVVIMGSSLAQSGGTADVWPGMVFGQGTTDKYKLPTSVSTQYTARPSSPNQYQLAQLGFASAHTANGYANSGFGYGVSVKAPFNGRSELFSGVDLVVITLLANGGDYRLECIEPIIRKLRLAGVEVLVVTDDPQNPSTDYATMSNCPLYVDGPEVLRIADLYGVEFADTAAYVFAAHLAAGGTGIYADTIHMTSGSTINGPTVAVPANGHEVWARAVRSIFTAAMYIPSAVYNTTFNFTSDTQSWGRYTATTATDVTWANGALVITKNTSTVTPWGAQGYTPVTLQAGDTVYVTAKATYSGTAPLLGMTHNNHWASNYLIPDASGNYAGLLTATEVTGTLLLRGYSDADPSGTVMGLDNVVMVTTQYSAATSHELIPGRLREIKSLPPIRMVTDMKTPASAFVIMPQDEYYVTSNNAAKGSLGSHPWTNWSFAGRFSGSVSAGKDLLTLATGKKCVLAGDAAVSAYLVHYRTVADGACTFNVNVGGTLSKTITVATVGSTNEWWQPLFTPTEFNATAPTAQLSCEIEVTSGTLMVAALVVFTADVTYLRPEDITYIGSGWGAKEASRSGLPGRWTDTSGDYAMAPCTGNRIAWVISGNPGSKSWDAYSGQALLSAQNPGGNYSVFNVGALRGPGETHVIKCVEANGSGSQANGHALHIGGAIVINDR